MNHPTLTVRCPAKVNLVLRVVGRRSDGYHELDTVFQAIDLWDRVEIRRGAGLELECDARDVPTDGTNLVLRAAELLRSRFRVDAGASFRLIKRIPAGGGLGGGSADAAGALVGCVRLWNLSVSESELLSLAGELGSDVPFFILGGTARGTGRGDRLERLPAVGPLPLVLGCPPFGIPTVEVYRRLAGRLTAFSNGVSLPPLLARKWPTEKDFGALINDLERVVLEGWPELGQFRDALAEAGARAALVSGSGSTVFGVFADELAGLRAVESLRRQFGQWRILSSRAVDDAVHPVDSAAD